VEADFIEKSRPCSATNFQTAAQPVVDQQGTTHWMIEEVTLQEGPVCVPLERPERYLRLELEMSLPSPLTGGNASHCCCVEM